MTDRRLVANLGIVIGAAGSSETRVSDTASPPRNQEPDSKLKKPMWMVVVHKGTAGDMMLHRLGFKPSTKNAGDYVAFYAPKAEAKMLRDVERLRAVGLHGYRKKIMVRRKATARKRAKPALAAKKPNAEILAIVARRETRLKHDAERRNANASALAHAAAVRQRRTAAAEADARARDALSRAKGER